MTTYRPNHIAKSQKSSSWSNEVSSNICSITVSTKCHELDAINSHLLVSCNTELVNARCSLESTALGETVSLAQAYIPIHINIQDFVLRGAR